MIEYIIIIILVVILFLSIRKTKFTHFKSGLISDECKYIPWGPNFDFCVNNCQSKHKNELWDTAGDSCTKDVCESKCLECNDLKMCEWLDFIELESKKKIKDLTIEKDTELGKLIPKKLNLSGISFGPKVTLTWPINNDADKYMIHFYDLTSYSDKINIIEVDPITIETQMSYDITSLKPNKEYNFLVYGINKYGISDSSNNINLKT